MKLGIKKAVLLASIAVAFAGIGGTASAAGFALIEQSGSGLGNAMAGQAAVAEDASTIFFNPAGMSKLDGNQIAVAGHIINVSAEFSGTGTRPAALGGPANTGGQGGDAGGVSIVPNLYFVMPYGDRMRLGIGVNVPFGLTTEYDDDWVGRFQGIKSELITVNINPAISYKLSDSVSIGAGINYQMADAELTNASVTPSGEGRTKLEADDDGWGWNVGVLFEISPASRIGVSYRSAIDYKLEGNVTTTVLATGAPVPVGSFPAKADVTFPDMISVSLAHALNDRVQLLADVTFTRWSKINTVTVIDTSTGATRDVLPFNFDDAWRFSIGANYKLSDLWTLKGGLAYDQTPVKDAQSRTVRLPDNDRKWIAVGGQLKIGTSGRLDIGYAHLFISDAGIDFQRSQLGVPAGLGDSRVTGTYNGSVDIGSVQYSMSF